MEYFPGHTKVDILGEIRMGMTIRTTRPDEFEDRIIFMSTFNDIGWTKKQNYKECFFRTLRRSETSQKIFQKGRGSFVGPVEEAKWYRTHVYKPEGNWNSTTDVKQINFVECEHSVIRASSALDRGSFSKKVGQFSNHCSVETSSAELLFRTINSVSQLSIYAAVADWCEE